LLYNARLEPSFLHTSKSTYPNNNAPMLLSISKIIDATKESFDVQIYSKIKEIQWAELVLTADDNCALRIPKGTRWNLGSKIRL
jgi:hypothetical protein